MYLTNQKNPHGGDVYGGNVTLDFSAGVNPLGMPEGAAKAAAEAAAHAERYPDPYCRALVRAIAGSEDVSERFVFCGAGASELIRLYCAAVRPARAMQLIPTFSEYGTALGLCGGQLLGYPLKEERGFAAEDAFADAVEREKPDAVFLCNPNVPTGRLIPPPLLERILGLCRRGGIRLFLDETFLDLTENGRSLKNRIELFQGLCVLKAFTKSYGMAGLRLGYCLTADADLLRRMAELSPPWNISGPAQAAGIAALREKDFLRRSRELISAERAYLKTELEALKFRVIPSEANFLLFHSPLTLQYDLLDSGIQIRNCANFEGLDTGWYRVGVRRREENERLIAALRNIVAKRQAETLTALLHSN